MPDPIFERYKEALRAGHVAALRGRPDDALERYREAAALAPDRPLPHVSAAEVLLRLGRRDAALAASAAGLRLAPGDDGVLDVAARAEEAAGNRAKAATHFDRLASLRGEEGRLEPALEAAERAQDLDFTGERAERVRALRGALEDARTRLASREWEVPEPGPVPARSPERDRAAQVARPATAADWAALAAAEAIAPRGTEPPPAEAALEPPRSAIPTPAPREAVQADRDVAPSSPGPAPAPADPAAPVPAPHGPEPSPPFAGDLAFLAAEDRADAGDPHGAARLYLEAAAAYLAVGAAGTAVDTCLRALARTPGDLDVHLALARVQASSGHEERARQAADLLSRLLTLRGDTGGLAAVAAFMSTLDGPRNRI